MNDGFDSHAALVQDMPERHVAVNGHSLLLALGDVYVIVCEHPQGDGEVMEDVLWLGGRTVQECLTEVTEHLGLPEPQDDVLTLALLANDPLVGINALIEETAA